MQNWWLCKENGVWMIRRGKERLPRAKYAYMGNNEAELRAYVHRLNAPNRTKEVVTWKHSFISEELIEEFNAERLAQTKNSSWTKVELKRNREHFLDFFIGKLNLHNPADWYRVHKTKWTQYLLSDEVPGSLTTKRSIIQTANRFLEFVHMRREGEFNLFRLEPLSNTLIKDIKERRKVNGEFNARGHIPDEDWLIISQDLPEEIEAFTMLAYCYGVRRGETLGFLVGDVRKGHLMVERQCQDGVNFLPTKGREERKVNHWFATPEQAKKWVSESCKYRMKSDRLTSLWKDHIGKYGFDYDFHALRHTFITKAVRLYALGDVQRAAGHKNIATTNLYLHDDRQLDDEVA